MGGESSSWSGWDIASAILNPIGSLINAGMSSYNTRKTNEANERIAAQNRALQKEFAQNSIQWKVNDVKAAGLHPLAAIGAQGTSYTPVHQDVHAPRFNLDFSQTAAIFANLENQKANTEMQTAQADYWRAMAKQVKDADKGVEGQNSEQMSGLVGSLKPNKSNSTNGDNIHAFGLSGNEIKQPLQDHAGEKSFFANQRTLAKGIVDGTIDYSQVDEYLTAFGPGVVTTNGETVMDSFLDTLGEHYKNLKNSFGVDHARAVMWIRKSNRSPVEKMKALKRIVSGDWSLFGKIIE